MSAYAKFKLPSEMTEEEKRQESYKALAGAVTFFVKPLIAVSYTHLTLPTILRV